MRPVRSSAFLNLEFGLSFSGRAKHIPGYRAAVGIDYQTAQQRTELFILLF